MKKRLPTVLFFMIFLVFCYLSTAQFVPEEIEERGKWETFLETAEITGEKQLGGGGVTSAPWRITLEKNGMSGGALWKNPEGRPHGYDESWKWEIAAYRLDKHLELHMIPPTVEREFQGRRGSCQLWVTAEMDLRKKTREKIQTPSDKIYSWNNAVYLTQAFDNLIANADRHEGSILVTKDWRWMLVDHSRSFGIAKEFTIELINSEKNKKSPNVMRRLPRTFVEKLKALDFELIKKVVGDYLIDKEIEAVLARRDLILKEIDKLIKKHGESDVLY